MRSKYLDLIRSIAVFLVLYGHLVIVAMYSPVVNDAIAETHNDILPMLDQGNSVIDYLEFLFWKLRAETAVVGVVIFFLLSGYLSVSSIEKYSGRAFLKNRMIRLAPGLWVATILSILIVSLIQGVSFSWYRVLGQMFMLYPIIQVGGVLGGVTWTLGVEILYYIIVAHVKKIDFSFCVIVNIIVAIIIELYHITGSANLDQILYYLKFIPIILIGAVKKITEDEKDTALRIEKIWGASIMAWGNLIFNRRLNGDDRTYPNVMTAVIGVGIFICICNIFANRPILDKKIPGFVTIISEYSYMIYLLQICVGFNVMYILKCDGIMNNYALVISAVFATVLAAWTCHNFFEKNIMKILRKYFER